MAIVKIMATDNDIQLADMLVSYPPATTPGFQTLISAKEEFIEMSSDTRERLPPGRGKYFKHQKFMLRFLRAHEKVLILDATGTGKSCSVLSFCEYTRKELEKAKVDPTGADERNAHFKRVIVLVKGPTQKNEFKNQLVCKCSDGRYETSLVKNASTPAVQRTNVTLEIKKAGYQVSTYTTFAHRIAEKYPTDADNERLADDFSDTIFWIDEAHNLLVDPDATTTLSEKQHTYHTIWRVLHLIRRSKIIISTATPMINEDVEIGSLMNLILPVNGILPEGYSVRNAPPNDIRVFFPNLPFNYETVTFADIFPLLQAIVINKNSDIPNIDRFNVRELSPYIRELTPSQLPANLETMSRSELDPLLSIVMGYYFQGQFPPDYDFKTATLDDLEPYMRGRVGFIRAADTGAIPEEQGILYGNEHTVNGVTYNSQLVLYSTAMSDLQSEAYGRATEAGQRHDELAGAERQAGNFVFPDGFWGNGITDDERNARREIRRAKKVIKAGIKAREGDQDEELNIEEEDILPIGFVQTEEQGVENIIDGGVPRAFRRYVEIRGENFSATQEFAPWLQDLDYISVLSCKYAEIVRIVMNEPGNAFVYGEYIKGSGAIVLALCLEGMGFVRYNENTSMFMSSGGESVKPYCSSSVGDIEEEVDMSDPVAVAAAAARRESRLAIRRRVRPNVLSRQNGGPLRYALLTRDTSDVKFNSMMEAMNSYENRHGDYIKVLISSRVGRDAINVNNVLQIHLIGPEWNQSSIYQALSRGLRATSHDDLIREERERIAIEEPERDPATARIIVKIYKHAAIAQNGSSIDLQMYNIAEYKDRNIKRIMRMMKQCAIGCQIHYNRNVRPTDIDGSPTCDYDVCQYQCVDPPPEEIDYSTYDVLYAGDIVDSAMVEIINIFRQRNALTLAEISSFLPHYRTKYLIIALEKIIINKISLVDRFGYTTYLQEDNGSFYLDRTYPSTLPSSYAMSYYTQGIIGIEQNSLANIVTKLETGEYQEILNVLENIDPNDPQFESLLNNISIEGQASILEEVIIRIIGGVNNNFTNAIINKYQRMIFQIHEPITELNKVYNQLNQLRPKRGRKRNPDIKRRVKKINPITIDESKISRDEDTEIVYLHTLYSQIINQTGYATTARFNKAEGRIRLLKASEINYGWRDISELDLPVYNAFIQIEIATRNRPFENQGIYGFVLNDGKFRIRDRLTEDVGAADDARKIKRGKVCNTWYRPDLIELMYQIGISEPGGVFPKFTESDRGMMIRFMLGKRMNKPFEELQTWSLDKLTWFYKWYSASSVKRDTLCDLIRNHMAATGRLQT